MAGAVQRFHAFSNALVFLDSPTTYERGWSVLANGELLDAAERAGYRILITTDHNLRYQQHLAGRRLAILVLLSTSWLRIRSHVEEIRTAVEKIEPGEYREIPIA